MSKQHSVSERSDIDDWKQVRLADVATKRAENVNPEETDVERNVGLKHIKPNTPTPDWEPITNVTSTKRRFYPGDILFAKLRPNLEKAAQPDFGGVCSTDIFTIEAGEDVNSKYLLYRLSSKPAFDWARRTSVGTRMPRTSWGQFSSLMFKLPPLEEQKKIAGILFNIDLALRKTREVIEKSDRVMQGVMVDVFADDGLEKKRVTEVTELVSGAHVNSDDVSDDESLTPYITGPDDFDRIGFTVSKYTDAPTKFCEEGDTLVTVKGSGCGSATLANRRVCISRQLKALRPSGIDSNYLYYYVKHMENKLSTMAEGSAIPGLSNSHLNNLKIPLPEPGRQHEIGQKLRNMDEYVILQWEYISQLKTLKSGLMQDLLKGDVRTTGLEIDLPEEVTTND